MKNRPPRLDVFLNEELVGSAFDTDPISFEYLPDWLAKPTSIPIGRIPKREGRHGDGNVIAFFDNLLPEGDVRRHLQQKLKASTVFGLLCELGGDSVGAFVLLPPGEKPKAPSYERTSWDRIGKALRDNRTLAIDIKVKDARISLSGAQDKTSIALAADGVPMLPRGYSPSTHIVKPDIRSIPGVFGSAANETIIMRAARGLGMDVAEVFFEPASSSCVITRFDRLGRPPDAIQRLVQYDLCQLSGTPSGVKYEAEGGPGLRRVSELIRAESSVPAVDLRRLVDWMFFNIFIGNNDSHAKNLSIYHVPGNGPSLTPFYDLVSTRVYKTLSADFAFRIGRHTRMPDLDRKDIEAVAEALGMKSDYLLQRAEVLAQRLPAALDASIEEVKQSLDRSSDALTANLRKLVLTTMTKTAAKILR